ncbi:Uncharacterised protein [Klebsiella pneumoniae]|nr:Uncharacterised protein [Klebsiella pneumoniae]
MRGFNAGNGQRSGIGCSVVMQARAIRCGDADFQQTAARWRVICAVCRANHKRVFRVAARATYPDLLPYGGRQPDAERPGAGDIPADPGGQQPAGANAHRFLVGADLLHDALAQNVFQQAHQLGIHDTPPRLLITAFSVAIRSAGVMPSSSRAGYCA